MSLSRISKQNRIHRFQTSHGDFRRYLYEALVFPMPLPGKAWNWLDFGLFLVNRVVFGVFVLYYSLKVDRENLFPFLRFDTSFFSD